MRASTPVRRRAALAALGSALLGAAGGARAQADAGFEFVALGDMPYGPDAIVGPPYRHLIDQVNQLAPPFTIHIGDFKDGLAACDDAEYRRQWEHFQRFEQALVYTPGDNDWLDCQRRGDDPLERLQALRERFFSRPSSLGRRPIAVERQSDRMPAFARYRENLRWQHQGVLFATIHTVGPQNGYDDSTPELVAEAGAREAANRAWLRDSFAQAALQRAPALVVATQAEPLRYFVRRPQYGLVLPQFASIRETLLPLAESAPFPVLLVHGDFHRFRTGRPFLNRRGRPIANLWRLEVFGAPHMHAVRVRVQPQRIDQPFAFTPIWNLLSPDPRQPAPDP